MSVCGATPRPCLPPSPAPSTAEAAALERELLEDYRFGRQQLVELCGHASAVAVAKVFPLPAPSRKQRTVLVVCGPEQNGAVGLACARHLRAFEYEPSVFYPTRSLDELHRDLTTQCEKMDIPFLSYLPTEVQLINDAYGLVVDAVLGPGARLGDVGGPCTRALATLKQLSVPLVSLDIPSGTRGAPHPLQCRPRVMGIPRTGRRGSCPQVTRAPATPHAQLECPLPTPGPAARADVSSLSRGRARPGRRPAPAGAIRRHAVGTNSPAPGLRGGGWTPGVSPSLRRLRGRSGLRGEAACPVSERAVWDRVPFSLRVEAGVSEAVGSDGGAGGFHSVTPDSGQRQERRRGP